MALVVMGEVGGAGVGEFLEREFGGGVELTAEGLRKAGLTAAITDGFSDRFSDNTAPPPGTLPSVVHSHSHTALSLYSKSPLLTPLHTNLALSLARYYARGEDGDVKCGWRGVREGTVGGGER